MERSLQIDILQIEAAFSVDDEEFSDLDVIVQSCQMERGVAIVLGFVDKPGAWRFGQENPHRTEK